jgi:hypothetical protein
MRLSKNDFKSFLPLPRLTHLALVNCYLHPDVPIFTHLTFLEIDLDINLGSEAAHHRVPLTRTVAIIKQAPLLKHLNLRNVVDFSSLSDLYPESPVHIMHLLHLELEDDLRCVTALLNSVKIPVDATLELTDRNVNNIPIDLDGAVDFLATVTQHPNIAKGAPCQYVAIRNDEDFHGHFRAYHSAFSQEDSDTPALEVALEIESMGFAAFFRLVTERFKFEDLTDLEVELDADAIFSEIDDYAVRHIPTPQECIAALRSMPRLRLLHLAHNCTGIVFCKALVDAAKISINQDPKPLLPGLTTLKLETMTIVDDDEFDDDVIELFHSLTDVVRHRHLFGNSLHRLVLTDCNIGGTDAITIANFKDSFRTWVTWVEVYDSWTKSTSLHSSDSGSISSAASAGPQRGLHGSRYWVDDDDDEHYIHTDEDHEQDHTDVDEDLEHEHSTTDDDDEHERSHSDEPHDDNDGHEHNDLEEPQDDEDDEDAWVTESDDPDSDHSRHPSPRDLGSDSEWETDDDDD